MAISILFADVETGGFSPERHPLLEIALIPMIGDHLYVEKAYHTTIQALPGQQVDVRAIEKHGIGPLDGIEPAQAFVAMFTYIVYWTVRRNKGQMLRLAGYNVGFDGRFLDAFFAHFGYNFRNLLHSDTIDVLQDARRILPKPKVADHKLETVAKYLGIEMPEQHLALPDAIACARVHAKLNEITAAPPEAKEYADGIANTKAAVKKWLLTMASEEPNANKASLMSMLASEVDGLVVE